MTVMVITIINVSFWTITKGLVKRLEESGIEGRAVTIQIDHSNRDHSLRKSVRMLRRAHGMWGDCCYSNFSEIPSVNAHVKNLQWIIIIIICTIDQGTWWLSIMPYTQRYINRHFEKRKERGQALVIMENCGNWGIQGLEGYINQRKVLDNS